MLLFDRDDFLMPQKTKKRRRKAIKETHNPFDTVDLDLIIKSMKEDGATPGLPIKKPSECCIIRSSKEINFNDLLTA